MHDLLMQSLPPSKTPIVMNKCDPAPRGLPQLQQVHAASCHRICRQPVPCSTDFEQALKPVPCSIDPEQALRPVPCSTDPKQALKPTKVKALN